MERSPNVQQHLDSLLHWILLNKEKMTFKDLGYGMATQCRSGLLLSHVF